MASENPSDRGGLKLSLDNTTHVTRMMNVPKQDIHNATRLEIQEWLAVNNVYIYVANKLSFGMINHLLSRKSSTKIIGHTYRFPRRHECLMGQPLHCYVYSYQAINPPRIFSPAATDDQQTTYTVESPKPRRNCPEGIRFARCVCVSRLEFF
jgi:hypothetical protein